MDIVVLQVLIAAGLIGVSLWWYRHNLNGRSSAAGCVLWVGWIVFGSVSLVYLVASGPEAGLFGGIATWIFCMAGALLGSRLLVRAFPYRAADIRMRPRSSSSCRDWSASPPYGGYWATHCTSS